MGISRINLAEKLCGVKHEIINQALSECSALLIDTPGPTPQWLWAKLDSLRCNVVRISTQSLRQQLNALREHTHKYCDLPARK